MKKTVLTGIKPTGKIHLGNYFGAIKPALDFAKKPEQSPVYFVADYHGLTNIQDPKEFQELTYGVAATWLALGLDPEESVFYRQSDVPEIFELTWILSCLTPKGLMNRAHAYKSIIDENQNSGREVDFGVNMGTYTYPILMASDILMFQSDIVPVGKDQVQHVEIARDIADNFNRRYGDTFNLPEYVVQEETATIPGLDGRKMSKSYKNTIPLFAEPKKLKKLINKIKTDSTPPEVPKDPDKSALFSYYKQFANPKQVADMRKNFNEGIGWGDVKNELFLVMNSFIEEPREKYNDFMANPKIIDDVFAQGRIKARKKSLEVLRQVKESIGISLPEKQ